MVLKTEKDGGRANDIVKIVAESVLAFAPATDFLR